MSAESERLLHILIDEVRAQTALLRELVDPATLPEAAARGAPAFEGYTTGMYDANAHVGVQRYELPDGAWLVIYYTGDHADASASYYEDKHGNRIPVVIDEHGNYHDARTVATPP